ncbi:MAG: cbb3-type cytochrome c oxidase subunit 3 [Ignavibacteria bacterium]|nr:cbb3-type cytochrome c oxidase subunit 3 [Ignavibacteria bacterium]MBT8381280.1 cbb3-type cytochrome c oxidase subunit 3 [Ignavibacteria bacterium]MBT8390684.1 cbb3-type cytochrome c oxidase subunit 3 [Ignavibacteria bacterium]
MYKDILQSIDGVEFYAIAAMMIFILFFLVMIVWLIKVDKNYIKKMSELPLKEDNETSNEEMNFKNLTGRTNEV